jgi:hypothetical protein
MAKQKPLPPSKLKMSPKAYREAIQQLGMSQMRAGQFFGFSDRHGQRMARGQADVLLCVIHLIHLMRKYNISPDELDPRLEGKLLEAAE